MIGNLLITEIVIQRKIYEPDDILRALHKYLKKSLNQENNENDDGMDVCLVRIEKQNDEKNEFVFSGAKRPLCYYDVQQHKVITIKGNIKTIGDLLYDEYDFENHHISTLSKSVIYLTTDEYIDQNNYARKRFGRMAFLDTQLAVCPYPNKANFV